MLLPRAVPDALHDGEFFYTLKEARIIVENWRRHYNTVRPHGSLGYKPPAPEVFIPAFARAALQPKPAMPHALAPRPSLHEQSLWIRTWGPITRSVLMVENMKAGAKAEACGWTVPVFDGACVRRRLCSTAPVFDGRRRHDLRFERIAEGTLPAGPNGVHAGPAVKCRVHYDSIAGRHTGTRWRTSSEPMPPSHVWFARPAGTVLCMPVRFEADIPWAGCWPASPASM